MGKMGSYRVGDESEGAETLLAARFDHRQHRLDKTAATGALGSKRQLPPDHRVTQRTLARIVRRLDDLDFVAAMLADPEVMRYYPECYSREEAATWVQRQIKRYARHGHGLWLALDKATGQPVGQVGLLIQQVHGVMEKEVAYLIRRPYWRRGFATEAGRVARDYAFEVHGRQRVIALIRPEIVPSIGVARKLGLQEEPDRIQHSGFDRVVFSRARQAERPV
jgi:RimJ/RimL family protein N-acetyltransferase